MYPLIPIHVLDAGICKDTQCKALRIILINCLAMCSTVIHCNQILIESIWSNKTKNHVSSNCVIKNVILLSFRLTLVKFYISTLWGSYFVTTNIINIIRGRRVLLCVGFRVTRIHNHWNENVVILMKFSSLAALEVVILTTFSAASDENFIKMKTFPFQWQVAQWFVCVWYICNILWHT